MVLILGVKQSITQLLLVFLIQGARSHHTTPVRYYISARRYPRGQGMRGSASTMLSGSCQQTAYGTLFIVRSMASDSNVRWRTTVPR